MRPGDNPAQYMSRAVAALEKARRPDLFDLGLELMLGRLYVQKWRVRQGGAAAAACRGRTAGYSEGALLLAVAQDSAGTRDDAIETLESAAREQPEFYRGQLRLADIYERQREMARGRRRAGQSAGAQRAQYRAGAAARDRADQRRHGRRSARDPADARSCVQAGRRGSRRSSTCSPKRSVRTRISPPRKRPRASCSRRTPSDVRGLHVLSLIQQDRGDVKGAEGTLRDLSQRPRSMPTRSTRSATCSPSAATGSTRPCSCCSARSRSIPTTLPSSIASAGPTSSREVDQADAPLTTAAAKLQTSSVVQDHLGDLRFKQQRFADAAAAWERALAGDGQSVDRARDREEDPRRACPPGEPVIASRPPCCPARDVPALSSLRRRFALAAACAPTAPSLPSGVGAPFPEASAAYAQATAQLPQRAHAQRGACAFRPGRRPRLRGRILAGFAEPAASGSKAPPAPFGRPVFIRWPRWQPRDPGAPSRRSRGARARRPAALIEALAGIALGPDELRAAVADAGSASCRRPAGRSYPNGWLASSGGTDRSGSARVDGAWRRLLPRSGRSRSATTSSQRGGLGGQVARAARRATPATRISRCGCRRSTSTCRSRTRSSSSRSPTMRPLTLEELRRSGPLGGPGGERRAGSACRRRRRAMTGRQGSNVSRGPMPRSTWTCACSGRGRTAITSCARCSRPSSCTTR